MDTPPSPLVTVIVLCDPGPKWRRASKPVTRAEAAVIVGQHWRLRRLARLHPPRLVPSEGSIVVNFVARPGSPYARRKGRVAI